MSPKTRGRKRSKRKRLGQYFTPTWIVDYIVQHTLGPVLQEDPERLLGEFSVLDPACGDGAFLIGALRFLAQKVESLPKTQHRLLFRSVVDSIHGVDIDPKALKSCQQQLEEASKKLLNISADFSQRILLGNSLIQTESNATTIFGNKLEKMHPLDWHRVYPWVMRDGGFDVIIGNPPFLGIKAMDDLFKNYIRSRFRTVYQQFDILIPFIELGLKLLRPGGRLGYIISNKILAADYGTRLRKTLVSNFIIEQMVDLSHLDIFENAATYPHIIILRKPRRSEEIHNNLTKLPLPPTQPSDLATEFSNTIPQYYFTTLPNFILAPSLTEEKFSILRKLVDNTITLGQICNIRCGIAKTGFTKHLISKDEYTHLSERKKQNTLAFLNAGDVRRYHLRQRKYFTYAPKLTSDDQWQLFHEPKIVIAGMAKHLRVALDSSGHALGRVYYITQQQAPYNPYFLLAVLNSRLINAYFSLLFVATHLRSGYIRYNATYLNQIPLATPTPHQEEELVDLATLVVQNPKYLKKGLDQEIDQAVANLYELSSKDVERLER
jgi:hypothetical protein